MDNPDRECEFCGFNDEALLYSLDGGYSEQYTACPNCLLLLATHSLTPQQFLRAKERALAAGLADGNIGRFYLHSDFYDPQTGIPLQPLVHIGGNV